MTVNQSIIIQNELSFSEGLNKIGNWIQNLDKNASGFTYNGAKLLNMLPPQTREIKDPNTFKTVMKKWIWENIPSY